MNARLVRYLAEAPPLDPGCLRDRTAPSGRPVWLVAAPNRSSLECLLWIAGRCRPRKDVEPAGNAQIVLIVELFGMVLEARVAPFEATASAIATSLGDLAVKDLECLEESGVSVRCLYLRRLLQVD